MRPSDQTNGGQVSRIAKPLMAAVTVALGVGAVLLSLRTAGAQPVVNAVVNAASYVGGSFAPGEMVVIFGTGLGPNQLTLSQPDVNGNVPNSLAGVTVTFNGILSPLIYVSSAQIVAITPFELPVVATAQLKVTYSHAASQPFTIKLIQTAPGVFSADASGSGNSAALNADGSRNNTGNPAQPGALVSFYLTGVGFTTPAGVDGTLATAPSSIDAPVAVTIGGIPAAVSYAGSVPGKVTGFARIDVTVPPNLPYGGDVPLFVQVGNVTSQAGLTVAMAGSPAPWSAVTSFSPNSVTISTSEGAPYGDCDFWSGSICASESNSLGYGPTKVMRLYICLSGQVTFTSCSQNPTVSGPLSQSMLSQINTGIAAYSGTGIRLLIRFIYNFGPIGANAQDAPLNVILTHIDQLAPILLQNRDLIFALEAGFIGTWGEWHDSTNGNDTAAAHKAVLDKELGYFSNAFPILNRDPGILLAYNGTLTPSPALGIHDDYYASSSDDAGTWNPCDTSAAYCFSNYTQAQITAYGAAVSQAAMFAGEFGAVYSSLQSCSALDSYSYMLHPQSIALSPYPVTVATELQKEGCGLSFFNQAGTRIVLQRAGIFGTPVPAGQLSVALTMTNAGYGRVIRSRPATLVLLQNGHAVAQIPVPLQSLDLRTLASFTAETFQFSITLPTTLPAGPVDFALLIPDPAPSLSSSAAYALPLNSLDTSGNAIFDPSTGYNRLAIQSPGR
jgi:uncharacterized protein (TIGR03437 family)